MPTKADFSHLPAIDDVLASPELSELTVAYSHRQLADWSREAVSFFRQQIRDGQELEADSLFAQVVARVTCSAGLDRALSVQRVVNATGVLLHTNLGRSPLAPRAVERLTQAAGYTNVELDLDSGKRSHRGSRVCELISQLVGAEDAIVVNNCAAATMLALQGIAFGKEVIVSRGQLVEIGGGFRLPEVFRAAGVKLKEVGTTNRTYLRDYEQAIGEETGAIIRVHRSNFFQGGFVTEPGIEELMTAQRPDTIPVIDDLGSGCLSDWGEKYGLATVARDEPTVAASMTAGSDLCLFSGDKLFGGPQCGIIAGKSRWLKMLKSSPMMRALRTDKLTLAALEATVEIHLAGVSEKELPFYRMLTRTAESIRVACENLLSSLEIGSGFQASVEACKSQVGGGSMPGAELESWCVQISALSSEALAAMLRRGKPAVQCRQEDGKVILDLRTVGEGEIEELRSVLQDCLGRHG